MNRRRPLLGLDPVLLTTAQRRYAGAHAPNNPGLAAQRKRNGQRNMWSPLPLASGRPAAGSVYKQSAHTHRGEMGAFTFLSSTQSHEKQGCQHKARNDRPGGYDDLPTATCKHSCRRQSRDNRDRQQDQCEPGIEHPSYRRWIRTAREAPGETDSVQQTQQRPPARRQAPGRRHLPRRVSSCLEASVLAQL